MGVIRSFFNEILESEVVNEGVGIALGNSAHVSSSLHLEVPSVTPGSSPRILNVPEAHSVLRSKASGQHGVVHVLC